MAAPRRFVARPAPARPVETEPEEDVNEHEDEGQSELDLEGEPETEASDTNEDFEQSGTLEIPEIEQPKPALVEEDASPLPDHVLAEQEAGRKGITHAESKTLAEIEAGKKAVEHHTRRLAARASVPAPVESVAMKPNPGFRNAHDQKMSTEFKAGGQTPAIENKN